MNQGPCEKIRSPANSAKLISILFAYCVAPLGIFVGPHP